MLSYYLVLQYIFFLIALLHLLKRYPFVINRDISFACEILMRLVSRELILNIRG